MIIDCIGCLHGVKPDLPGGDLLIVTGDLTAGDTMNEWHIFNEWLCEQQDKYKETILIAGNHDNMLQNGEYPKSQLAAQYLCDSGTEFERLKIWGSPWVKFVNGMNPHCAAFTCDTEEQLAEKWALIPNDIDILITHGPPYDYLDHIYNQFGNRIAVGSESLYDKVTEIYPKLHIFSHIHEGYGVEERMFFPCYGQETIKFINCSIMNNGYEPVNKPVRVVL